LKRHYVPSGTFLIGKTKPLELKALPGTCMPVAACGPRACRAVLPTAGR